MKIPSSTAIALIREQAHRRMPLAEVGGICSLIFLPYAQGIESVQDAKDAVHLACSTDRGFGQYVFTSFHPADQPNMVQILTDAGWSKIADYPSGHPVQHQHKNDCKFGDAAYRIDQQKCSCGADYHMEMWGMLTGQVPH